MTTIPIPSITTNKNPAAGNHNQTARLRNLHAGGSPLMTALPEKTRPSVWLALTRQRTGRPLIMTNKNVVRVVGLRYFSKHQEDLLSLSLKHDAAIAVWYSVGKWGYFKANGPRFEAIDPPDLPEGWAAISVLEGEDHKVS